MEQNKIWLDWAVELQSLAQAGLTYGKDVYDKERYERIREISAEILSHMSEIPLEKVKDIFCNETGYQTPKIDTRAAIFKENKILLVRENNGAWSLPGGWCDVNVSVGENTVKEVKEESGLDVEVERLIAIQDRAKHNKHSMPTAYAKFFRFAVLSAESSKKTLKPRALNILQRTACRFSQAKRATKSRLKCALTATGRLTSGK